MFARTCLVKQVLGAYSIAVTRIHGMDEFQVRLPVGPLTLEFITRVHPIHQFGHGAEIISGAEYNID